VEETNEQTRHMNVTRHSAPPKRSLEHMTSDVDGTRSGVVMKRQKRETRFGTRTWRKYPPYERGICGERQTVYCILQLNRLSVLLRRLSVRE